MKKPVIIFFLSFLFIALMRESKAQITDVTIKNGFALVKNVSAKDVVKIEVCSSCKVAGFNGAYLVVYSGPKAVIFNSKGKQTGTLKLKRGDKITEVNSKDIIIKEASGFTVYYDFVGTYKKRERG